MGVHAEMLLEGVWKTLENLKSGRETAAPISEPSMLASMDTSCTEPVHVQWSMGARQGVARKHLEREDVDVTADRGDRGVSSPEGHRGEGEGIQGGQHLPRVQQHRGGWTRG